MRDLLTKSVRWQITGRFSRPSFPLNTANFILIALSGNLQNWDLRYSGTFSGPVTVTLNSNPSCLRMLWCHRDRRHSRTEKLV